MAQSHPVIFQDRRNNCCPSGKTNLSWPQPHSLQDTGDLYLLALRMKSLKKP